MAWSAPCSALARRSTVNPEQLRAMGHPAQHLVVNLGPSRETTAKCRQKPMHIDEGSREEHTQRSEKEADVKRGDNLQDSPTVRSSSIASFCGGKASA